MDARIETAVSLPKTLFNQAEILAQQLHIPLNRLFEIAIENFIKDSPSQAAPVSEQHRVISQGDIYWIQAEGESELGYYAHPYVVIQDNLFNYSRIHTVVVCALTSNIQQASEPGNVLLEVGEANLPKHSAVVVSKVSTVVKTELGEYIGTLTEERVNQILAGMRFLHLSFFAR